MSEGQLTIAKLVKQLPEDQVDLVWRSRLNERLRAKMEAASRRRRLVAWVLRPALGLSVAAAIFLFAISGPRPQQTAPPVNDSSSGALEAALVDAYHSDVASDEITPPQAPAPTPRNDSTYDPYTVDTSGGI
jgi:hypothetical protein